MKIDTGKLVRHAKASHGTCHGTGVVGRRTVVGTKRGTSNILVICPCVFRELKRIGVDRSDAEQMRRAIGVDPPDPAFTAGHQVGKTGVAMRIVEEKTA